MPGPSAKPPAPFADTNVLLCLLSADAFKADRAESLLAGRLTISVQVLNEFANVARRKLSISWPEITDVLGLLRQRCTVRPLTLGIHETALAIVQRHALAWYDALIVAAAADANCRTLRGHAARVACRPVPDDPQPLRGRIMKRDSVRMCRRPTMPAVPDFVSSGKGSAAPARARFEQMAFRDLHSHRFRLDVKEHDTRALALYAGEGFAVEGRLRECVKTGDGYDSLVAMSVLASEYHARIDAGLEAAA